MKLGKCLIKLSYILIFVNRNKKTSEFSEVFIIIIFSNIQKLQTHFLW